MHQPAAEKRVTEVYGRLQTRLQDAANKAREAADQARKATVYATLNTMVERGLLRPLGPRDGKSSIQLPLTVEPSTGLHDGQTVTVSATGFVPGESVGLGGPRRRR